MGLGAPYEALLFIGIIMKYKMKNKRLPKSLFTLLIDVETHMRSENNLMIYDIGGAFGDIRSDKEPITFQWYVAEHIAPSFWNWSYKSDENTARTPYRFDGRADRVYHESMKNPCSTISLEDMFNRLTAYIEQAQIVTSWNWGFDSRAINATWKRYNHSDFAPIVKAQKKAMCLWDIFHSLEVNKNYYKFIKNLPEEQRGKFLTESGNIATRAEVAGKKFSMDFDYTEAHWSLKDVKLEWSNGYPMLERHIRAILYGVQIRDTDRMTIPFVGNVRIPHWSDNKKELSSIEKLQKRGTLKIPEDQLLKTA